MLKRKNQRKNRKIIEKKTPGFFNLPGKIKHRILSIIMCLVAIIIVLSFFNGAGVAGRAIKNIFLFLIGEIFFILPLFFILGGLAFWGQKITNFWQVILAILFLVLGTAGSLGALELNQKENFGDFILNYSGRGGWLGNIMSWPLLQIAGFWVAQAIFGTVIIIGGLILWYLIYIPKKKEEGKEKALETEVQKMINPPLIKKIFQPKFRVKEIEEKTPVPIMVSPEKVKELPPFILKTQPVEQYRQEKDYQFPPLELLEKDRGTPNSGDIRVNSAIIKRTLQNFDIQVEMSEINIGPTVTQYALKPAEGIKLSRITALASDLSLALAAHPIRIEAPIPGRPLMGIEVPNKVRTLVRLRNLLEHPNFQNSVSLLTFALGRDVSGNPAFADLARMPHLLVAGSTGTGKTICLNSIILSLLYQNSPQTLRLILVDPKRVEFPVYNGLPHLLVPAITDVQRTVNTLKWLTEEMERRFEVLSEKKSRDIANYNETIVKEGLEFMPYIVLIIDELADLMAARGREIEAGIVRLAQMARAVGIHLIVATQRPSVEIITGLIKANITSRITFQVASQVDSRTVFDMAGAEKLLGSGDMLFISAEITKPRRIQGVYTSEKEVRNAVNYIKSKSQKIEAEKDELSESLKDDMEETTKQFDFLIGEEDPLYEEAKKVVTEAKKASSSLLQRRLRIGYARAARLIDMLEQKGVVGPGEGAKPREVYLLEENIDENSLKE